jgi:FAD/FMN-containing dehydrogenase
MLDSLTQILSPEQILTDDESIKIYGKDWLKQFEAKAQAIVFPRTTEEVQKLVPKRHSFLRVVEPA